MRRLVVLGLRLLGVAVVVVILVRIQYRDLLLDPGDQGSEPRRGTVEEVGDSAWFQVSGEDGERVPLPADWASRGDLVRLGLLTNVRRSDKLLLVLCALLFGPAILLSITRWWYLLLRIGVRVAYLEAFRLSFIGAFFNNAMPGLTGGDLVKAFYIARQARGAGVRAFVSVYVDRLIGLFALGVLATALLVPKLGDRAYREAAVVGFLFLSGVVVFGLVFLFEPVRRLLRVDSVIRRLPFSGMVREVDRAIVVYRKCPGAVGWGLLYSVAAHVSLVVLAVGIGRALGIDLPAGTFFVLVPVGLMVASIPLLPGGWGAREGAFVFFFGAVGVAETQAFALSVLFGLAQLAWSLLGGLFFFRRPDRVTAAEVESFSREVRANEEPLG